MHWRHSDFQIHHFIAGKAHTPDEAYRLVAQELENRRIALKNAEVARLRAEAAKMRLGRAEQEATPGSPAVLEARAALLELTMNEDQAKGCVDACRHEVQVLEQLLEALRPSCRYVGRMPDHEAFQEAQAEEWCLELEHRARVMIAAQGFIPWDHLETMSLHPAFKTRILPVISQSRAALRALGSAEVNVLGSEGREVQFIQQSMKEEVAHGPATRD